MRKILIAAICATAMLLGSHTLSQAYFYNGNEILGFCLNKHSDAAKFHCAGYVSAVFDILHLSKAICPSSEVDVKQVIDITIKQLQSVPEIRDHIAADLIATGLVAAFPCGEK